MIFTLIVAILFVSGCAMGNRTALNWAVQDELKDAHKLIQTGQRRQAIDELTMLLKLDPKNERARFLRGMAYQGLEEFSTAIEDFEALIRQNPHTPKAHYNLGMIYAFKINDPPRALMHFDSFLSLKPQHSKAFSVAKIMSSLDGDRWSAPAAHQELSDRLDKALNIPDPVQRKMLLSEWAQSDATSPVPHYLMGKIYEYEGRSDQAVTCYRTAIQLSPTCGPCHRALGQIFVRNRKKEEGQIHLLKAKLFAASLFEVDEESLKTK